MTKFNSYKNMSAQEHFSLRQKLKFPRIKIHILWGWFIIHAKTEVIFIIDMFTFYLVDSSHFHLLIIDRNLLISFLVRSIGMVLKRKVMYQIRVVQNPNIYLNFMENLKIRFLFHIFLLYWHTLYPKSVPMPILWWKN